MCLFRCLNLLDSTLMDFLNAKSEQKSAKVLFGNWRELTKL
uniref:Uncharacterized protein n=1 Tax=Anguilla anguilla TaxID=7936 RepID=A0A0E9VZ73_ANGAN